ncbi:MAG: anthranilate phosphoribosyltransferase [Aeromicrobium erythreum]
MTQTVSPRSWPDLLAVLSAGDDLDAGATTWAMREILDGNATPVQIAGFAVALRVKGETVDELRGLADEMLAHATLLQVDERVVDIVGTGGDRAQTVNISTMSAVVIAGAGIGVVKHGNRAASSRSGSADVLEALGVRLDVPADEVLAVQRESGITFCFAPVFHASFRHTAQPRRELGVPTPFNWLGPLTNPARPAAMAVGCANAHVAPIMAGVFASRGTDALVFRGEDGLDEVTVSGPTRFWSTRDGGVEESVLAPEDLGLERAPLSALRGGDAAENAAVFRAVVAGEHGPVRDAVLLNAATGIAAHAGESAAPLAQRLAAGIERARESIDSGAAQRVLDAWAAATQRHAPRD